MKIKFIDRLSLTRLTKSIVFGWGLLVLGVTNAQTIPTPGDISRQLEPARPVELPALQLQPQRITQPSKPKTGDALAQVQRWVLQGNTILADDVLQTLLLPFTLVELSLPQIREAAAVVQQAYEDAGWIARVEVPPQDVTAGSVRLQIIEARMGEVRLEASATTRVAPERLQAWVYAQQPGGQALYRPALDRGLLLADDLSGVSLVGALQASTQPQATDVILNAAAEPAYSMDVSADNSNARSVGANRVSASGAWASPAGYGESYSAQAFKSEGSDFLRVVASAPLGYSGLKGSVSLSQLDYKIITPDSKGSPQDINGRSQSASVDLSYPLLRSNPGNVYLTAGLEDRHYLGHANGELNSHYLVQGGNIGLIGNFFDRWGGSAANSYSLSWREGRVQSGQVQVNAAVDGHFAKTSWSFSRQQSVRSDLSLFASINGQNTDSKVLDGSENFILGGPSGVRAYPVSEGAGPQGRVINLELRWRLTPQWLITPFYDHGLIEKRSTDTLPNYNLQGAGVSVTWTVSGGWMTRATLAHRIGDNPNANAQTGNDQDGSLNKNRFWLTTSHSF
jgi:hemolysin activation/secretion protein